jgi:hypothetical protein
VSTTDVFISYARADRPIAQVFAEALIEEGFNVWWDASLHSGETFDEVIEQRLRDAKAVVVLWSPRSVASRWVRAEATLADRRNTLIPAIIEPCDRPIVFELTHTAELCHWRGDRSDIYWRIFINDVSQLIRTREGQAEGGAQRPQEPTPASASIEGLARVPLLEPHRQPLRPRSGGSNGEERLPGKGRNHDKPSDLSAPSKVHCLEIEEFELPGELIVMDSGNVKIGRCPPADIVLSHKSISREHCIISVVNDELLVTDLQSTNGTYIDEVRISGPEVLPVGSVVRLGQVSLQHAILTNVEAAARERTWFQPGRIVAA